MFEGLTAIHSDYKITAINQTARRLLNLSQPEPTPSANGSAALSRRRSFYDAPQTNKKDEIVTFNQQSDCQPDGGILNNEPLRAG
ncbi:hypothetical protein MJ575_04765 [Klebsiella pneumoniae]|nr:hypothetical protein MJ575_04765 [Klebsiella pneumoniae]